MYEHPYYEMLEDTLEFYADEVQRINRTNGWYESDRTFGDDISLLHSEVSEMLEAYRDHGIEDMTSELCYAKNDHAVGPMPNHLCKPEGVGSEAADVLVRLLDTCRRYEINLGEEFIRKLNYNATRGHRHGGKRL